MSQFRITDVCGTLVHDDTTIGLLSWHFSRTGRWRLLGLKCLTASWSPFRWLIAIIERVTHRHILKHLLVGWLEGDSAEQLSRNAEDYAVWLLCNRRVASVQALLESTSGELVLASASLEPVVSALAQHLEGRYVSSRLEVHDGVCTGRYAQDITGLKIGELQNLIGNLDLVSCTVISDNLSDRNLLEGAGRAYVVLHRPHHRSRWVGLDAEYLSL